MSISVQSMTGFARNEARLEHIDLIWEVRSVNHRHLDTHLKLPENLRQIESQCRTLINNSFTRGRIDANLQIRYADNENAQHINIAALKQLKAQLQQATSIIPELGQPSSLDILMTPGVLEAKQIDETQLQKNATKLLQQTLDALKQTRCEEGVHLSQAILNRLTQCREHTETLKQNIDKINDNVLANYRSRIEKIAGNLDEHLDEQRLAQEFAILITRADVSEEIDRLEAHYAQIKHLIVEQGGAIGRRLDFLMQELNREANTLGSKAHEISLTNCAVELKVLIDQMREQIQNIE